MVSKAILWASLRLSYKASIWNEWARVYKFQVFPDGQERKTNLSVCFLREVMARQFCFEIYWPLEDRAKSSKLKKFVTISRIRFWRIDHCAYIFMTFASAEWTWRVLNILFFCLPMGVSKLTFRFVSLFDLFGM